MLIDCAPLWPDETRAEQRSRWFWIDVRSRSVVVSRPESRDDEISRLAEFVRTRLDENAWDELLKWFWTAKIQSIEKSDPSEIEIDGLPEAENGEMVPFVEVFPLGLSLNFTFENAAWAAGEQYCVQPECTCRDLVLCFLQLKDPAGTVATTVQNVPACRYNYRSRALNVLAPGDDGTPPLRQLLSVTTFWTFLRELSLRQPHRLANGSSGEAGLGHVGD